MSASDVNFLVDEGKLWRLPIVCGSFDHADSPGILMIFPVSSILLTTS